MLSDLAAALAFLALGLNRFSGLWVVAGGVAVVGFMSCGLLEYLAPVVEESTQEDSMSKEHRGFASMDRNRRREIASKGGKVSHQKGAAHEWTSEEAREAGRKGGKAAQQRKRDSAALARPT